MAERTCHVGPRITVSCARGKKHLTKTRVRHALQGGPGRRFHMLYDKVYRREVLQRAWELVRRNGGAAGIDQLTP